MPRLAANLNWLFAERPFVERFGAAAAVGFSAVELLTPYEHAAAAVRAELALTSSSAGMSVAVTDASIDRVARLS